MKIFNVTLQDKGTANLAKEHLKENLVITVAKSSLQLSGECAQSSSSAT